MHHFRCKVSAAKSNISTLELFHPISSIGRRRGGVWRGREGEGRWLQKTMALGTPMGKSDQPTVCTGRDRVVGSGEAADRRVASVLGRGGAENSVNNLPYPEDPDRSKGGVLPPLTESTQLGLPQLSFFTRKTVCLHCPGASRAFGEKRGRPAL